jgi:hypothetical protein
MCCACLWRRVHAGPSYSRCRSPAGADGDWGGAPLPPRRLIRHGCDRVTSAVAGM